MSAVEVLAVCQHRLCSGLRAAFFIALLTLTSFQFISANKLCAKDIMCKGNLHKNMSGDI
ncbi:hypothetical protein [Massilia sp. UBA6681]|uniref:hypothetical protein n=1 Tax=Massilia sp. UBA6681 TaxID=1946839 RepID=UPI0025C2D430|nr:hypothetical protein [Massilia sp. UBA6681]